MGEAIYFCDSNVARIGGDSKGNHNQYFLFSVPIQVGKPDEIGKSFRMVQRVWFDHAGK